jgi:hypothetical protein
VLWYLLGLQGCPVNVLELKDDALDRSVHEEMFRETLELCDAELPDGFYALFKALQEQISLLQEQIDAIQ